VLFTAHSFFCAFSKGSSHTVRVDVRPSFWHQGAVVRFRSDALEKESMMPCSRTKPRGKRGPV